MKWPCFCLALYNMDSPHRLILQVAGFVCSSLVRPGLAEKDGLARNKIRCSHERGSLMKIIVMGCGRVGMQVSLLMEQDGHEVTVIDYDAEALAKLGPKFKGRRIKGVGFDRNVLVDAGIQTADAFAATSSSDNVNIVAARIARNIFRVPRVVARLYDPRRAEIYQRLGLLTISSTNLGAERIRELITHAELEPVISFGRGEVNLMRIEAPPQLVGRAIKHLVVPGEINVISLVRQGQALIPFLGTELQTGDIIYLVVLASAMDRFSELLGLGEGG
jgi:trk system potassium uptake protein TrkA